MLHSGIVLARRRIPAVLRLDVVRLGQRQWQLDALAGASGLWQKELCGPGDQLYLPLLAYWSTRPRLFPHTSADDFWARHRRGCVVISGLEGVVVVVLASINEAVGGDRSLSMRPVHGLSFSEFVRDAMKAGYGLAASE